MINETADPFSKSTLTTHTPQKQITPNREHAIGDKSSKKRKLNFMGNDDSDTEESSTMDNNTLWKNIEASLSSNKLEIKSSLDVIQADVAGVKEDITEIKEEFKTDITALKANLEANQSKLDELTELIKSMETKNTALES